MTKREGIMLAYPYDERRLQKWFDQDKLGIFIQAKYEGDRCRVEIDDHGEVRMFSSSARLITTLPHIEKAFKSLNLTNMHFDGELYKHGMPHEIIRSLNPPKYKHPRSEELEYHIFDLINDDPQDLRIRDLQEVIFQQQRDGFPLKIAWTHVANEWHDIEYWYNRFIEEGYEGIIFRRYENLYQMKRSTSVMKLKPRLSGIYKIVGFAEEISIKGEPKQALGSFTLIDDEGRTFEVGSGFTRAQREDFWNRAEHLLGKMCKIRYQALTLYGVPKMQSFESIVDSEMEETECL